MLQADRQTAKSRSVSEWAWFFVPFALLLIPFANFAKSNAYSILSPEILLAVCGFLLAGIVLGALGRINRLVRTFILASVLTLLVDVQSQVFEVYSLHQYMWLPLGLWLLAFMVPRSVENFFLIAVYGMLLAVIVTPKSAPMVESGATASSEDRPYASAAGDSYWIHIILDEHIGIESIPSAFDPDRRLARTIRQDYVDDGFIVYGRAFTRFSQTHLSLPNILNFTERHPISFLGEDAGTTGYSLLENRYLMRLRQLGYKLNVYGSDYFRICDVDGDPWQTECKRYYGNTIWGFQGISWPATDKAIVILRMYARLSKVYSRTISLLDLDEHIDVPQSITPLVALKVTDAFARDVVRAQPGSAWLLHVFLPHEPYSLDETCAIRDLPWIENGGHSENYRMNTEQERQVMYPLYLAQVECTHRLLQQLFDSLREAGIYNKANIVVHGDHGSRVATVNLSARPLFSPGYLPSPRTLVDYYGTFFAFKAAGQTVGQYRREMVPVATLLDGVSAGGLLDGITGESDPHVNFTEWADTCQVGSDVGADGCRLVPVPLPHFSRDDPVPSSAAGNPLQTEGANANPRDNDVNLTGQK